MQDAGKTRLRVEIFGQQYTVVGKEPAAFLHMVAGHVDDTMRQIAAANPRLDVTRLAILAALNIAGEYFKLKETYERLLAQERAPVASVPRE